MTTCAPAWTISSSRFPGFQDLAAGPGPAPVFSRGLAEPESAGRWERERLAVRRRTGEGFVRGRGLAAVILVFWSQPAAVAALLIAVVLLSCRA
jgi:hypothetical protein